MYKACISSDICTDTDELNLTKIDEMCNEYNLKWRLIGEYFYIFSWCGKWYFKPFDCQSEDPIILYHHNQGLYRTENLTSYHKQKVLVFTPYEIIEYIHKHDNFKYSQSRVNYISDRNNFENIFREINGGNKNGKNKNSVRTRRKEKRGKNQ